MFEFPSSGRSDHIETFLTGLAERRTGELSMPLELARGGDLGSAAHAVQAIATWAETSSDRGLVLPESFAESRDARRAFASTLPGMAALYFSERIRTPLGTLNRLSLLEEMSPFVRAMDNGEFENTTLGQGVALCCFAGAKQEFLGPLYYAPRRGAVRQTADVRLVLSRILGVVSSNAHAKIRDGLLDFIGDLVQELVQNSDEHGSVDLRGDRIKRGMRGLLVRYTTTADIENDPRDVSLMWYLTKIPLLSDGKGPGSVAGSATAPSKILELTIFDTGPGLALRWVAERKGLRAYSEIDPEEEIEAVGECFRKHATSKSGSGYGFGLARSLLLLRKLDALLSLRTGRLSPVQDFSRSTEDARHFSPKNRLPKRKSLSPIAGACYTICIRVD